MKFVIAKVRLIFDTSKLDLQMWEKCCIFAG